MNTIYNSSPIIIQNWLCSLQGLKIRKQRFNHFFKETLADLEKSQTLQKEDILTYKEEKLHQILEHAYSTTVFYKQFFDNHHVKPDDFKTLEDIRKFPVLTKEHIREHFKDMISSEVRIEDLIANHTSGSSGKALDFYQTKTSLPYLWAVWWRFRNRFGVQFGDKHLNFTGKLVVPITQKHPPYWRINKPLNQWLINMQHISSDKVETIVDMVEKEQFVFFAGYPSIIHAFASLLREKNIVLEHPPRFIFTGAEKMYDNQREDIEIVMPGVVITDHYGTSEGVINASKCCQNVYHEDFELGHLECEEPHYLSSTEYEGDILGTSFRNYGMPFIRYKIGDSAIWSNKSCSCGLHSQVIRDIQGRSEDYVITPEGLQLKRFDYLFKNTVGIKECQVVQQQLGEVLFRIVRRDSYSTQTEEVLRKGVADMISPTIACRFEYVNEIKRTIAGKFKAVVSEL